MSAQKLLGFHLSLKTFYRIAIASGVMGLVVFAGYHLMAGMWFVWQLAVLVPIGGAIYLLFIFKTKAVTQEMMDLLKKR
jgi:hypothetical protein